MNLFEKEKKGEKNESKKEAKKENVIFLSAIYNAFQLCITSEFNIGTS